jgi:hypothetical protein
MSIIKEYLLNEKHMSEIVAEKAEAKITKYEDICAEFEFWLINRTYNTASPLVVNNYSAQDIYKLAPFMDGLGVFNFMVSLRDNPSKAKEYIADGFKRK